MRKEQTMSYFHNIKHAYTSYFTPEKITEIIISYTIKFFILFLIIIALRIINRFARKWITSICENQGIDTHTCFVIKKMFAYSLNILGLIFALHNIGVNVSTLIAALGISGVAISFGMKDATSNIIAGILIMLQKQFKINDYIKIKDWEGKVVGINIKYTTLKTEESTVFVPNSVLYSNTMAIINKAAQQEK